MRTGMSEQFGGVGLAIFLFLVFCVSTGKTETKLGDADAYNNRGIAYYFKREYEKSWKDVEKAQSLGFQIHAKFLDELRKTSGRKN